MPFDLQIIRATEFVRIGPHGQVDMKTSKETLAAMAHACRLRGVDRALLDLRSLPIPEKPRFKTTELAELVGTFHEVGFGPHQWLAVLYQKDPHHSARTFAFISRLRGWRVRAFDNFESALTWLSEAEAEKRTRPRGQRIPIEFKERRQEIAQAASEPTSKSRPSIRGR